MQYFILNNSNYIKCVNEAGTVMFIPNDPANSDWQAYQTWLAADPENNIPQEEV